MTTAYDTLRIAVATDLPGTRVPRQPAALTGEVIGLAAAHRVQGLLWSAIGQGHVVGDDDVVTSARVATARALRTCLIAEETGLLAIDAMTDAGVDVRALKGLAISHLDHVDPARRVFGDADLLVRPKQYPAAIRALEGAGFRRAEPAHRLSWERRFGKSVVMLSRRGAELDLHLRITGGYFGERIDHTALWAARPDTFDVAGRQVAALDRAGRLLNACCHAVLGGSSGLRALHDVALLASTGDDWATAVDRATADGVDIVLARAIQRAWEAFGLSPHHPAAAWAQAYTPSPAQAAGLATYSTAAEAARSDEDRGVMLALSPLDKARYLAGLAFPPRAYVASRGRTYRSHLAQGWAKLRGAGHS